MTANLLFKFLQFGLGNGVSLGDDWDDVDLVVKFLHGHKVKGFQAEMKDD